MSSAAGGRVRTARARRSHRGTGAAIFAVLVVVAAALVAVVLNNRPQYRVQPGDTTSMIQAITAIPGADVDGADPVVRPPGTTRSYYSVRGRVSTVVYVSHEPVDTQKQKVLDLLASKGWTSPANIPPGRVATEKDSYTAVFANKSLLLQLAMTRIKDITSVTYIIQTTGGN